MNIVVLIGNVASDVTLRHTNSGKAVANFRIAINNGKDKPADFFSVVVWERQAELVSEYLAKGNKVGLEGKLTVSQWESDGVKREKIEVTAHRVDFLTPKGESGGSGARFGEESESPGFGRTEPAAFVPIGGNSDNYDDDDIPF